jgi:hypothetical protein
MTPSSFGGEAQARPVEHRVERAKACPAAQQRVVVDVHVVRGAARGVAAVDHPGRARPHARRGRVDEEKAQARGVARRTTAARDDDQPLGAWPSSTNCLLPSSRQPLPSAPPRSATRVGSWRGVRPAPARARLARGHARQPGATLVLRCRRAASSSPPPSTTPGQQRRGRQRAPDLLEHRASPLIADAEAAAGLGQHRGRPAEVGHLAPQRGVVAARVAPVAQRAQRRHRRALRQELLRAVAQHALFIVEQQAHPSRRQAQHALGDQVELDLRRTAGDGVGLGVQPQAADVVLVGGEGPRLPTTGRAGPSAAAAVRTWPPPARSAPAS